MTSSNRYARLLQLGEDDFAQLQLFGEAGYLWLYSGASGEAVTVFEAITQMAPDEPVGYIGRAEAELAGGDSAAAERSATVALGAANNDPTKMALAYSVRARAHARSGKIEAATRDLAAAAEMDPKGRAGDAARERLELLSTVTGDAAAESHSVGDTPS